LFGYATQLADEKEFFIRKAIGWALRDYARWNPQAVTDFLQENRNRLSGLTVREAAKHLQLT
jgi:3-methyladenine DNA glycosylase AlkD